MNIVAISASLPIPLNSVSLLNVSEDVVMETNEVVEVLTGTVIDLHPKSGETWSRAKIRTLTGAKWVVAKFKLSLNETVELKAIFNYKWKSYDVVELCTDGTVSNDVVVLKLIELLDGVGETKARRLSEKFPNLWETLQTDPAAICAACGATPAHVAEVVEALTAQQASLSRVTNLVKLGYPNHLAKGISQSDAAYQIAIVSPYAAIKYVSGLGWLIADEVGRKMGVALNDPTRIEAGIWYFWTDKVSSRGHTRAERGGILHKDCLPNILGIPASDLVHELSTYLVPVTEATDGVWYTTEVARSRAETIRGFFAF